MSYTSVTVSGYNASPPSDDGSEVASNRITWAGIKSKLGDPVKAAVESVNTNVAAAIATTDAYPATWAAADTALQTSILATLRAELNAPTSTSCLFKQTAAPTGWTKQTDHNDKALRIVSGTPSSGGSTAFTSVFASRTITQANLPNVTLSTASLTGSVGTTITNGTSVARNPDEGEIREATGGTSSGNRDLVEDVTPATLSLASGTVSFGGNVPLGGSGTAMDFAVQYVDVIYATKN